MKIALAQINPTIGDLTGNCEKITQMAQDAQKEGADLVVFSEMVVSGYPCRDLLDKPEFVRQNQSAVSGLIEEISGPAVLLGHFEQLSDPTGKQLANSATLFQNGKVLATHRKILLPTYDVFDELRYFEPGDEATVFEFQGMRLGLTVCEDIWNFPGFYDAPCYGRNPITELKKKGVDAILNVSASPYRIGRGVFREELGRAIVRECPVPFVLVNQVGGNDDLIFDGHSFAMNAQGETLARAPGFQEGFSICDLAEEPSGGTSEAFCWETCEEEEIFKALTLGVRDYLYKCGYQKAVIGLSGGIDSSVVAVIAKEALGADNVTGISMPSPFTATASVEDAKALADNLGIRFEVIPIEPLFEAYKQSLSGLFAGLPEDVTEENLQARIRGNLLMALSNKHHSMVLSTGNKSEMSVGYCTLYGDMAGGLSVIADVMKTRVYWLARWMNKETSVIPNRVLTRAPTAELRPDQTDQDSLPPYEVLDPILEGYVENHLSIEELVGLGFQEALVKQVISKVDRNEYKRNQAAPVLKITGKAFGSGRRIPMAQRFLQE